MLGSLGGALALARTAFGATGVAPAHVARGAFMSGNSASLAVGGGVARDGAALAVGGGVARDGAALVFFLLPSRGPRYMSDADVDKAERPVVGEAAAGASRSPHA
ncbi:MAG: hypothetical protein ABSD85_07570 [Acidimicrobiales bacterium]|jgi:hypothetical protein